VLDVTGAQPVFKSREGLSVRLIRQEKVSGTQCWGAVVPHVDGGGKRGQKSGGLVAFRSDPFPLGMGCSLRTARSGQGRAVVARRSEPLRARTGLRSSCKRERCGPEWTAKMAQSLAASDTISDCSSKLSVPPCRHTRYCICFPRRGEGNLAARIVGSYSP
jgi:hypothetical protein